MGAALYGNLGIRNFACVWRIGSRAVLTLAFLIAGGAFSLQLSGLDPRAPVGADSASLRSEIATGLAFLVVSLFGLAGRRRIMPMIKANAVVLLLPLLAVASAAWAPEPAVALRRALAFAATVLSGVAIAAYLPGSKALRFLVQAVAAAMAASLVYVVVHPAYAIHQLSDGVQSVHAGEWRGMFIHRSILGRLAALSLAMAIYAGEALGPVAVRIGVILASLLCMVMAHSGSGFASAAILLATPWAVKVLQRADRRNRLLALSIAAASALLAVLLTPVLAPLCLHMLGKDPTLTGRTDFWRLMLQAAVDRPLLGYGYSTGFRDVVAKSVAAHSRYGALPNAHNGYLDVVLNLGLVGLVSALSAMALAFWRAIRLAVGPEETVLLLLIVVFIAESNVVEATLINANDIFMLISVTALVASGEMLKHRRVERPSTVAAPPVAPAGCRFAPHPPGRGWRGGA